MPVIQASGATHLLISFSSREFCILGSVDCGRGLIVRVGCTATALATTLEGDWTPAVLLSDVGEVLCSLLAELRGAS